MIVTHQHIDHLGLVEIIVEHSGAEVAAIGVAAARLANFDEDAEAEDRFAVELMRRNGISEEVTGALQSVSRSFRSWGSHVEVTRPLDDGEEIAFRDRTLQALHRPGPQPLRHRLLGRGAADPDRRRPPARPHLLQPADLAAARRLHGARRRRWSPTSSR